jgi:hypothetical protein
MTKTDLGTFSLVGLFNRQVQLKVKIHLDESSHIFRALDVPRHPMY